MFKENSFHINKKITFQNIYRYQFLIFFNYVYKDYSYEKLFKKKLYIYCYFYNKKQS